MTFSLEKVYKKLKCLKSVKNIVSSHYLKKKKRPLERGKIRREHEPAQITH